MPANTRTLNWYETKADNDAIKANGWRFQIAKLVASSPNIPPTYNIVWQSKATAPSTKLSWKVQYALGWTADPPSDGVTVNISGPWQPCNLGDSYDVDADGYWTPSTTKGQDGWLNVGLINYSYPGVQGIHIVVGVWNIQTASYDPIYVDKTALPHGSSAQYQPHENVSWWLQGGDLTGQVFSQTQSPSTSFDFSVASDPSTNTYEYSTSYLMTSSDQKWVISKGPPPGHLTAPPRSAKFATKTLGGSPPLFVELDPGRLTVFFKTAMTTAILSAAATALSRKLDFQLQGAKVTYSTQGNGTITVEYKANAALLSGGASGTSPKTIIDADLVELRNASMLPPDEAWEILPASSNANNGTPAPDTPAPASAARSNPPANGALQAGPGQSGFGGGQGFQQQQQQQQPGMVGKGMFTQNFQTGVAAGV